MPVLLVGAAVLTGRKLHFHGIAERPVETGGVFGRIRENGCLRVAFAVQRRTDCRHLAVHHPAGRHDVGPCHSLSASSFCVYLQGGVIVYCAVSGEHPAVAVVGVFVYAEVGDEHDAVAEFFPQFR